MAAEYSAIPVQSIAVDENVIFANGSRACHMGYIQHRDTSGIFFLKGSNGCNKAEILRKTGAECPTAAYIVQPPQPVTFPTNSCGQDN